MEVEREREREKKEVEERCASARQAARSLVRALAADPETCIRCARLSKLSVIFVVFLESGSADGCVGKECVREAGACGCKACVACATMKKKCVRPKPNANHPGPSDAGPSRSGPPKGSPTKSTTSKADKSRPVPQRAVLSGWRPVMEVTILTPLLSLVLSATDPTCLWRCCGILLMR